MYASVRLELNSSGFKGNELDEVLPDFMVDRPTCVGLTWYPSAEGPESFSLIVIISVPIVAFSAAFASELAKDLYHWSKSLLVPLFSKKSTPIGEVEFVFDDVKLACGTDGGEDLTALFEQLPGLLEEARSKTDLKQHRLRFDSTTNTWCWTAKRKVR